MTTTAEFISSTFQVTLTQARDFVMSHVADPSYIYGMAKQYGVTSQMLGEIVGYQATEVEGFFNAHGLDGAALHQPAITPPLSTPPTLKFLSLQEALLPQNIISLNQHTGALSTDALHASTIAAGATPAAYDAMFNPSHFVGYEDGVFTPDELGSAALGFLPATSATLQSVFFGTVIAAIQAIDPQEADSINNFGDANAAAIAAGDPAVLHAGLDMLLAAMSTPASQPAASDSEIAGFLPFATAAILQLIGTQPNLSPFQVLNSL